MKYSKYYFQFKIIIIGFIISSCGRTPDNNPDLTQIVFEDASDTFRLTDEFKNIRCVQLEMTDQSIIGWRKRIISSENEIIVLSDNEILLFDKQDGKFLHKIGTIGEGPEEYVYLSDICYDPEKKNVVAYDRGKKNLISFTTQGEFVRSVSIPELAYMHNMTIASDGIILSNNMITDVKAPIAENSYTIIEPNGSIRGLDPFAPLYVGDYFSVVADRPMSRCGSEISFVKIFNDTVFSLKNGDISPKYKLDFGKKMPSKEFIAELGPYPSDNYKKICIENGELTGIDNLFETKSFIALVPNSFSEEGYYWIDKRSNKGIHISATPNANLGFIKVLKGNLIRNIVFSNENEIISSFDAMSGTDLFKLSYDEVKDECAFPPEVISAIEKFDPEGNPFLIFYEH